MMRALVLFTNVLLLTVLIGCQASTAPTSPRATEAPSPSLAPGSASPSADPTVTSDRSGSPSASVATEAVAVAEAGRALLEAENTMTDALGRASTKYCTWRDTAAPPPCTDHPKVGKPYWTAVTRAVQRYVDALHAIRFPAVAKSAARTEMDVALRLAVRARDAAAATTTRQYIARAKAAQAAIDSQSAAIQPLKDSLGLPVGP